MSILDNMLIGKVGSENSSFCTHAQQVTELRLKIASLEEEKNREVANLRRRSHIEKTLPVDKFVDRETGQFNEEKYNQRVDRLMKSSFTEEEITEMYEDSFAGYPCAERLNNNSSSGKTASSSGSPLSGLLNMFEDIQSSITGPNNYTSYTPMQRQRQQQQRNIRRVPQLDTALMNNTKKNNGWFLELFEASNFNGGS